MILKIGTRGSKLALAQSYWVRDKICSRHPDLQVDLVTIKTTGDRILDSPLSKIGGKGLFVKEIEQALLEKKIDLAVHSMKDVPAELPDKLCLPVFPEREDPSDAFVCFRRQGLEQLPQSARVGTSSLRRTAQLRHIRPDLNIVSLRGNVDTRLGKLASGELDGIILAMAGLNRLGYCGRISQIIPQEHILPAIGQGALGLELRQNDTRTMDLIRFLNHEPTEIAVTAERAFLHKLQGGCQVPIAGFAHLHGGILRLTGMVAEIDGSRILRDEITGGTDQAEQLGVTLAERLLHAGAGEILERVYSTSVSDGRT
ncbi:MAG: hydroxymethylbilane synthase [Deltaproteobacteria bacterium]|nr:MAG: hydroxymethylbilane synthase [Deltaproteobacteria bacterium]